MTASRRPHPLGNKTHIRPADGPVLDAARKAQAMRTDATAATLGGLAGR